MGCGRVRPTLPDLERSRSAKLDGQMDDDHDILTACALRFNGWDYKDKTGWDHAPALDLMVQRSLAPTDPNEILTLFFLLQRGLCKWDLVYESPESRFWWAYRELFFLAHRLPIPATYRHAQFADAWERDYVPRLDEFVGRVQRIHASIQYLPAATVDPPASAGQST